jgi:hypothetical protein
LDVVFLNQNQSEISPKIPLDPVSAKNNVVFKTAVKWMPKNYTNKDRNPNDLDISISTQHTDKIGFSCTKNIPISKYSNILKAQRLKRITEDTMKIME